MSANWRLEVRGISTAQLTPARERGTMDDMVNPDSTTSYERCPMVPVSPSHRSPQIYRARVRRPHVKIRF